MPTHSNALAGFPVRDVGADRVDAAGDFVSGDARILDAGPMAFFHQRIAVTDAAGFDLNAHLVAGGFGDGSLYQFEIAARLCYLDCFHTGHYISSGVIEVGTWLQSYEMSKETLRTQKAV